ENVFRDELDLPLLDVQNDTDPGFGNPTEGTLTFPSCAAYPGWDCGCNIATATLGSRIARQILVFGRAKRELESLTLGGVPLLAPMMDSYDLFSPLVAGDLKAEPRLRAAMLDFGVRPALGL